MNRIKTYAIYITIFFIKVRENIKMYNIIIALIIKMKIAYNK